ncbi:hypothetical protein DOT_3363 [Desulfosporosinus sp. OT]|nr:hypothetical protein DOT_3363 [Desulfosporosinus sp. OT]
MTILSFPTKQGCCHLIVLSDSTLVLIFYGACKALVYKTLHASPMLFMPYFDWSLLLTAA